MTLPCKQVSWGLWPLWVAASSAGYALGAAAHRMPSWLQSTFASGPVETGPVVWLVGATSYLGLLGLFASPALLQWLVLRHWLPRAGWWLLAGAVGSFLGFIPIEWAIAVGDTNSAPQFGNISVPPNIAVPAFFVLAGAVQGAVEWLVLRRWAARAGWWLLARSMGSFGAIQVFLSLTRSAEIRPFLGPAASGAVSGAVTGLVLVLLLRNTKRNEPPSLINTGQTPIAATPNN